MKKNIFILLVLFASFVQAQQAYLVSDRPDKSEGTYILPKKFFQMENDFSFHHEYQNYGLMLRYGLFSSTEIRLETGFEIPLEKSFYANETALSVKQFLYKGTRFLPEIALVAFLAYNTDDKKIIPNATLAFSYSLTDALAFDYNLATTGSLHNFFATAQLNYTFSNHVIVFVEYYATFGNQAPEHNLDAGVCVPIGTRFQLDFAFGKGLNNTTANYFFTTGVSYLLTNKQKYN